MTGVPNPWRCRRRFTAVWDVHAQYEWQGLHLRGLFTMVHIDDAGALTLALRPTAQGGINEIGATEVVASDMLGGYVEVAYDVLRWFLPDSERTLEPFFRFEYLDTQFDVPSGFTRRRGAGAPDLHGRAPVQADSEHRAQGGLSGTRSPASGSAPDEINLGFGLAF